MTTILHCDTDLEIQVFRDDMASYIFDQVCRNRAHLGRWLAWVPLTQQVSDSLDFLQHAQQQSDADGLFRGAIVLEGRLVGTIGYHERSVANRSASIGYWLDKDVTGRGVVTRSLHRLVQHGFEDLDLHRIEIRAAVGNEKSWRVAERVGFQREGCLRDVALVNGHFQSHYVYSLLRSEYSIV
mgnify:CR=1 FL=1